MSQNLIELSYDALTIDGAKQSASIYCPKATNVCYQVVVSSASTPVGTTLQIQGSLDGTSFANIDGTVAVSADGVLAIHIAGTNASFKYYRLSYTRSSGSYVATTKVLAKGSEL